MKQKSTGAHRFFFTTSPSPCPYLDGHDEQRVVVELTGGGAVRFHDILSAAGFRRSHSVAYAPACLGCDACQTVRVLAKEFKENRSYRRTWRQNAGLTATVMKAKATKKHFDLFAAYQKSRHGDGEMAKMSYRDYQTLIEGSPADTLLVEFKGKDLGLAAVCLVDRLCNGLSAVYSFYDPALARRSLGVFMILWLLRRAKELGLDHVYLGFYIKDCQKMSYKKNFQPLELLTPEGWRLA